MSREPWTLPAVSCLCTSCSCRCPPNVHHSHLLLRRICLLVYIMQFSHTILNPTIAPAACPDDTTRATLFSVLWCAKEAFVKARGTGISAPPGLKGFSVQLRLPCQGKDAEFNSQNGHGSSTGQSVASALHAMCTGRSLVDAAHPLVADLQLSGDVGSEGNGSRSSSGSGQGTYQLLIFQPRCAASASSPGQIMCCSDARM